MTLLEEIERYMHVFGVSPSAFGLRSGNGKDLVQEMRNGRVPRQHVQDRVRAYLDREVAKFRAAYN